MSDDATAQQRRFLLLVVGSVVAIGLVGGAIALVSGGGDDSPANPGRSSTPGSEIPTAETLCAAAHVTSFHASPDGAVSGGSLALAGSSAEAAASGWGQALTTSTATGADGKTTTLITVGKPGKPPYAVLAVLKGPSGWLVTSTTACLDKLPANADCAATSLLLGGSRLAVDASATPTAGAFKAQGKVQFCGDIDGTTYAGRGNIGPVTAFTQVGDPKDSVVVQDGRPVLFAPAR